MSKLWLVACNLADGDHYNSEESEHSKSLGNDTHDVEHFWDDDHACIERIEHIEQEHHVACESFHYDFYEEQR